MVGTLESTINEAFDYVCFNFKKVPFYYLDKDCKIVKVEVNLLGYDDKNFIEESYQIKKIKYSKVEASKEDIKYDIFGRAVKLAAKHLIKKHGSLLPKKEYGLYKKIEDLDKSLISKFKDMLESIELGDGEGFKKLEKIIIEKYENLDNLIRKGFDTNNDYVEKLGLYINKVTEGIKKQYDEIIKKLNEHSGLSGIGGNIKIASIGSKLDNLMTKEEFNEYKEDFDKFKITNNEKLENLENLVTGVYKEMKNMSIAITEFSKNSKKGELI